MFRGSKIRDWTKLPRVELVYVEMMSEATINIWGKKSLQIMIYSEVKVMVLT